MSFRQNMIKARGSLVFLTGITIAFGTVYALERWNPQPVVSPEPVAVQADSNTVVNLNSGNQSAPRKHRDLTVEELEFATIAWQYFVKNTNTETGLVNSVSQYPAATLWDTSSYLLGLISAHRLGIVEQTEFNNRTRKLLETLADLPLFDQQLPNKSYSTIDATMVTYNNQATERGIGWSAIDIGRVLVPLNVLVWHYPEFAVDVNRVLAAWQLQAIVRDAQMYGAAVDEKDQTIYLQEGRLGYEEYAAKSLMLAGMDLTLALDYEEHFKYVAVSGIDVGTDLRTPDRFDALNAVVSEPYVLDGLEFGWDRYSRSLSYSVYRAQQARYEQTGILTAVSEDHLDEAPYFVYNTVIANGKPWNTVTETGVDAAKYKSVSTKTVFGLHALFNTGYTQLLMDLVKESYDPAQGWYSGIYESTGEINESLTANTNGIVLESLHYIKYGPLLSLGRPSRVASTDQ